MSAEKPSGIAVFGILTSVLFVLRLILGVVTVPPQAAVALSLVATVLFLALPIVALFRASEFAWSGRSAGLTLLAGAVIHVFGAVLANSMPQVGFATVFVQSVVQVGIAIWTLGLGALVALMIKDKNLILPMAVFLAGLDVFLVFNPDAPTSKIIRQNPAVFQSMAVKIPAARVATSQPQGAQIVNQAFVGPADLLFMATFLVVLSKFKMKLRETAKWLVPVMIAYLLLVLSPLGLNMLPALVPIGITVLIVNRKEFRMSKEETLMAWGAVALSIALAGFGLYKHFTYKPKAEPIVISTTDDGQLSQGRATMPPPASEDQSR